VLVTKLPKNLSGIFALVAAQKSSKFSALFILGFCLLFDYNLEISDEV
jgi:hypothetical protein